MKYEIETYRGHLIQYDDTRDKFFSEMAVGDAHDQKERRSLVEIRKVIDQFIKKNLEFKPFKIMDNSGDVIDIVAIRTDGKFVDSKNNQYRPKNLLAGKRYSNDGRAFVFDPEIIEAITEMDRKNNEANEVYRKERARIIATATPLPDDFLKDYIAD